MRHIPLRQVRAVIAVCEEGSFTRAAERENATQSGISQHVAAVERKLGVKLFERAAGRVTPTPAGLRYYKSCVQAVGALENLDASLASSRALSANDYFSGVWQTNLFEGALYGIPWYVDTRVLFYRADLLARAVTATPAPWWLGGKTKGWALEQLAPQRVFDVVTGLAAAFIVSPLNPWMPATLHPLAKYGALVPAFVMLWVVAVLLDFLPTIEERIPLQAYASISVALVLHAFLAIVEIAQNVVSVPVVWPKCDGALVVGFGVRDMAHLLVDPGQAHQGTGIARIDVESLLKFPESKVVLAERGLELTQGNVRGGETIVDLQGSPAICESLIDPRGMIIHQEFQPIGFPESRVAQGKARVLFNGGVQLGNG